MHSFRAIIILLTVTVLCAAGEPPQPASVPATRPASIVRVAAIGGINDQDFWKAISGQFERETGIHVQTVMTGNKDGIAEIFRHGGIDLITIQSAESIMGLVADGFAENPQPWVKTELIIVGPPNDPAHIKDLTDAAKAVRAIVASNSPFIIHGNLGVDEVVRGMLRAGKGPMSLGQAVVLLDDHQKRVLQTAADKHAYTLISAIPFREDKIPAGDLIELVSGDPALRRPFVLAVANPGKIAGVHLLEARQLAAYLRGDAVKKWIDQWHVSRNEKTQAFFPAP